MRTRLAAKYDGPVGGLLDAVHDRSGQFLACLPPFAPFFWGGVIPLRCRRHGEPPVQGTRPEMGFEKGTIVVTHRQRLGPEVEPATELQTVCIHEMLLLWCSKLLFL